jgi:hypothetical protein
MQFLRRLGLILLWLAAPIVAFAAANKNDPYMVPLRGAGNIVLVATSIVIIIVCSAAAIGAASLASCSSSSGACRRR